MRHCRYPCLYTLRFTLLAPATLPLASNLSPYRLIAHYLPEAVFWRRCHRQMQWALRSAGQNLYPRPWERGSKNITIRPKGDKCSEWFEEHSQLDRRERSSMKGSKNIGDCSKNIEIYLVQLSDEGWEQEKWTKKSRQITFERLYFGHLSGDA